MPFLIRSLAVVLVLIALFGCDSAAVNNAVDNIKLPDVKLSSDPTPTPAPSSETSADHAPDQDDADDSSAPAGNTSPTSSPEPAQPTYAPPSTGAIPLPPSLPSMILCRQTGLLDRNFTKLTFKAADCDGGALPDSKYYGFPLALKVNGAMYEYQVEQPGDAMVFSPSVSLQLANGASSDAYDIRVLYVKQTVTGTKSNLILCSRAEATVLVAKSGFDHDYTAEECGGVKPDSTYTGMPVAIVFDRDPGEMYGYRISTPSKLSIKTNSYLGTVRTKSLFYSVPHADCYVHNSSANFYGPSQISFESSDCQNGRLPNPDTFAIPTSISLATGSTSFVLEQPLFGDSSLTLLFKAIGGGGNAYFSTSTFPIVP